MKNKEYTELDTFMSELVISLDVIASNCEDHAATPRSILRDVLSAVEEAREAVLGERGCE